MSNQHPSTEITLNAHQREAMNEFLQKSLREFRVGRCTPDVMRFCVAVLVANFTERGIPPPHSEVKRLVVESFRDMPLLEWPLLRVLKTDTVLAETCELLSEATSQAIVEAIGTVTPDIDGAVPCAMTIHESLVWLRCLAIRAICLKEIGSYTAAIQDCTFGLSVIEQRNMDITEPNEVSKMILNAILVLSKLKMGSVDVSFDDAIESCGKVLGSGHSSAVMDLANATLSSLTSTQQEVESTLSLPLGLNRAKGLYRLCPGCIDTFTVLLRELSNCHQYHQVASAYERWVMSVLPHHDLVGLPETFAPAPGFPVSSIFDGADSPFLTVSYSSAIVASTSPTKEAAHHYFVALLMQDRWKEAGYVVDYTAGKGLHVESYWLVLYALEMRRDGDLMFESRRYDDATEKYKKGLERLMDRYAYASNLVSRVLEDDARRLLTATLRYKIGMCLVMQGKRDDALWNFRSCLADVPDFMEALEESAHCHWKLKEWSQAKTFCRSYIDKYERKALLAYPNVRGITFPNQVEESAYQRIEELLTSLDDQEKGALRSLTGPSLPASPPSQAGEQLHGPNHPSPMRSRCNRPVPNDETVSALDCFGMNASSAIELIETYRDVSRKMELVAKYIQVCDAFEVLHLDPATRSMSAIEKAAHRIGPENGSPEIDEAVKTAKTHVACKILELTSLTDLNTSRGTYLNPEEKLAFEFVCSCTGADPNQPSRCWGSPLSASSP